MLSLVGPLDEEYAADVSLKARDIAKLGAAVQFRVKSRQGMLGTIEIGQGGFRWKPRDGKAFRSVRWGKLFERLEGD